MPYQDPEKQKEAKRQWYLQNKELTIKRSMGHKHRDQEWFKSIKSTKFCVDCGESLSISESSKSIGAINYFESLLGNSHSSPEFEKGKVFAISVLQKSKYLTENFAKAQIGEIANNSIMTSSGTLMSFTLPIFLPDIFSQLDEKPEKNEGKYEKSSIDGLIEFKEN